MANPLHACGDIVGFIQERDGLWRASCGRCEITTRVHRTMGEAAADIACQRTIREPIPPRTGDTMPCPADVHECQVTVSKPCPQCQGEWSLTRDPCPSCGMVARVRAEPTPDVVSARGLDYKPDDTARGGRRLCMRLDNAHLDARIAAARAELDREMGDTDTGYRVDYEL